MFGSGGTGGGFGQMAGTQSSQAQRKQRENTGDEKSRLQEYDEAMRRIKDATGVSDVNEIIQKFATQYDTYNNLVELKSNNEKKLTHLQERKGSLKTEVEKMRYEGQEILTRKKLDEMESSVNSAQTEFERNKENLERINKVIVNAKSGIEHLCEKIADIKVNGVPNVPVTDSTLVEALQHCDRKLEDLTEKILKDDLYEEAIQKMQVILLFILQSWSKNS